MTFSSSAATMTARLGNAAAPVIFLSDAVGYARRGWEVFPLRVKGKMPLVAKEHGGRGCLDATRDEDKVREWWSRWPRANIGIATGSPSGFFAIDIDPRHGGPDTLRAHIEKHGRLPRTIMSRTGGGGLHLLFRHVPGIRNDAGRRLGPGLDVRGDGGYIVAPPSVHESGRPYAWDVDRHPDETPIAVAPDWLVQMAITPAPAPDGAVKAELPENGRRLVADGVGEGARNSAIASLSGHLLRRRLDPLVTLDLLRCWNAQRCRPPLTDEEVIKTVNSIAAKELRRRRAT